MVVVGLTGGIGTGKSTVAAMLADRGAVVVDADQIARQVVEPAGAAYAAVVEHFGAGVLSADGSLDRGALAARVFGDPAELAILNAITHPAIARVMLSRVAALAESEDAGRPVVLDIPLLTESVRTRYGLDRVVVVDAPAEMALRRLVEQRGLTESDARARMRAQPSREERLRLADMVVENTGSREELQVAVDRLWDWLRNLSVDGAVQETLDAHEAEDHQEDR